jgi:hypothetical protein
MKKVIFSILCVAFLLNHAVGQAYNTALGVRIGMATYNGFCATLSQRLAKGFCVEGIYQSTDNRYAGNLLFKWHEPFVPLLGRGWNYYFGLGGHYGGYHNGIDSSRTKNATFYGASGMLGTEFTIGRINIGLDWMPSYSFQKPTGEPQLKHDVAFSIRYVLFKAPKNKGVMENLDKIFKDSPSGKKNKDKESKEL